jgi:FXSXX-COOH protein
MTTTTDETISSVLADLGRVPLEEMQSANAAVLSETLNRVLPTPDQVSVAAFNSFVGAGAPDVERD